VRGGALILEDAELPPRSPARTPLDDEGEEQNPLSATEAQVDALPLVPVQESALTGLPARPSSIQSVADFSVFRPVCDLTGLPVRPSSHQPVADFSAFRPVCASCVELVGGAMDGEVLNCKVCLSRVADKVLQEWPTEDFKGCAQDDHKKFLTEIEQIKSMAELQEFVFYRLEHRYLQETQYLNNSGAVLLDNSGAFLPLSVWAAKGFDTDAMKRKARPCDIQVHPVFGMTYRAALSPTPVPSPCLTLQRSRRLQERLKKAQA